MICERNPNCPPPTPSTGPLAELYDVASGDVIWSITETAETFSNDVPPVISPDGRYALISMPRKNQEQMFAHTIALVEMNSGKVLQEIPSWAPYQTLTGFSNDSRDAWISNGRRLATYNIDR
jgi:hypothetical protein